MANPWWFKCSVLSLLLVCALAGLTHAGNSNNKNHYRLHGIRDLRSLVLFGVTEFEVEEIESPPNSADEN